MSCPVYYFLLFLHCFSYFFCLYFLSIWLLRVSVCPCFGLVCLWLCNSWTWVIVSFPMLLLSAESCSCYLFQYFLRSFLCLFSFCCCSVSQARPTLCNSMNCSTSSFPTLHHPLELAQTHVHWIGDAIQPSYVIPFFSYLQSFPASGSFLMNQFFASGSQSIGTSASASDPPMNIQDWFPRIDWIDLLAV